MNSTHCACSVVSVCTMLEKAGTYTTMIDNYCCYDHNFYR